MGRLGTSHFWADFARRPGTSTREQPKTQAGRKRSRSATPWCSCTQCSPCSEGCSCHSSQCASTRQASPRGLSLGLHLSCVIHLLRWVFSKAHCTTFSECYQNKTILSQPCFLHLQMDDNSLFSLFHRSVIRFQWTNLVTSPKGVSSSRWAPHSMQWVKLQPSTETELGLNGCWSNLKINRSVQRFQESVGISNLGMLEKWQGWSLGSPRGEASKDPHG